MRIFKFKHEDEEEDYIASETELHATIILCESQDIDISELKDSNVVELKKRNWDDIYLTKEEGSKLPTVNLMEGDTLLDWMNKNEYAGYIAGTNN